MRTLVLSMVVGWLIANTALAGEACETPAACGEVQICGSADHCGRCGCACPCEKHCRVVCTTKEVKKTVWVVKCSDFCAPLPNCGLGGCCGDCGGCEACDANTTRGEGCGAKCNPCAAEGSKRLVPPKCGKVREKKTLVKKEIVCNVPSYKCVVVYCCPQCGASQCGGESTVPSASPAPASGKTTRDAPIPPVMGASYQK